MSELLEPLVLAWWRSIAPLSLQGGLLIILIAAIDRMLPARTWPELRAALWILALLKLILPPTLASPVGVIPEVLLIDVDAAVVTFEQQEKIHRGATLAVQVWLVGLVLLTVVGGWRYRRLMEFWRRSSTSRTPLWFPPLLSSTAQRLGLNRVPAVRFNSAVSVPFVAGILRPKVFLPDDLAEHQAEHVLLHEFAHVRRFDLWLSAVSTFVQLIYWFHPLVWWARGRLSALIEQCCDRTVTRALGGEPESYRRTLLLLATRGLRPGTTVGLGFLSPRSLLVARLRQLEHAGSDHPRLRPLVTTTIILIMLATCLPMARVADGAVTAVAEIIERPPGCLQLRYLVLQRLAEERRASDPANLQP